MKSVVVYIPQKDIEALDRLVEQKYYSSRNAAIRAAIKYLIRSEQK